MSNRVLIDIQDHVADVRMNRPERHNALDAEQFQALFDVGKQLMGRKDVRVIVLSGNGPSFCSGLDFPSFQQPGQDLSSAFAMGDGAPANSAQRVATVWRNQAVPVIAALHGVAYGGGFQIAMGADMRVAEPTAKLSIMEIEYGLIPDMAISLTLPPLIGLDVAMELTMTGRKLGAAEAQTLGLLTRVSDQAHAAAMQLAQQIAARSPDAIRATKALFHKAWPTQNALLAEEARLQQDIIARPNHRTAVTAALSKQIPQFED